MLDILKTSKRVYLLLAFAFITTNIQAQNTDSICVSSTEDITYDLFMQGFVSPFIEQGGGECFRISQGKISWIFGDGSNCCGEHDLLIIDQEGAAEVLQLHITVKCPKPDCFLTDVTDTGDDPTGSDGAPAPKVYACSESAVTYYLPETIGYTYQWSTDQGDTGSGSSIDIIWLTPGPHTITVAIYNGATLVNTITRNVEVLEAPVADFVKSASCVCLGGNISFDASSSIGASGYTWDFGDGNTGVGQFTDHSYDTPGTYNVVLTVTSTNYDNNGSPLCCCADTMEMEVIVENEEGPPIYWISTLCEGDSSIYWTDAEDCTSLIWTVTDADGNVITYDTISTDTIGVVWPSGPYGTISLEAIGCTQDYCTKPSVVQVPVISSTSIVVGDDIVCKGASENYSVPKWKGVTYDWSVTGGTIIDTDANNATVHWNDATATMGTISVTYYNDFLSGLMMADSCIGSGSLDVDIRPRFNVLKDTTVCVGYTSMISTNDASEAFTWTVSPAGSYVVSTTGLNTVDITWTDPGVYTVTAMPVDGNVYCIEQNSATIVVKDMAAPLGIDGDTVVCADQAYFYTALTDQSGIEFNWTVVGGTPTTGVGNPLSVVWDGTALTHSITLTQYDLNDPGCESDPITINIEIKELDNAISIGAIDGCTNQIQTYTATGSQHPDATVDWWVVPDTAGSVIDIIGQNMADIQWNNDGGTATIYYAVMLCGDTISTSVSIILNEPDVTNLVQVGTLCPGVPGSIHADPGFVNYEWSTGDNGPVDTTIITSPGTYTLTTTDGNGCMDVTFIEAVGSPEPIASISTNDRIICIDTFTTPTPMPPNDIEIRALTAPSYEYEWECGGTILPLPPATPSIIHSNTYVPGSFSYRVTVTDTITGCTDVSNTLTVYQDYCDTCDIAAHDLTMTAVSDPVYCNIFTFTETHSANVVPTSWDFADGNFAGYSGPTITHTYTSAGDFDPQIGGLVYGNDTCPTLDFLMIEVPLAPFFTYSDSCLTVFFNDYSSHIVGESIVGYSWDFDDLGATSTSPSPSHMFSGPGTYNVVLTITGASGCLGIYNESITVSSGAPPIISISPPMACVGESITFSGSHPNTVVDWFWDFGDGSFNGGQNAEHAYLSDGPFSISLTTLTSDGCESSATASLVVKPNPDAMGISASGPLEFCDGDDVTLSVTATGIVTYSWSTTETTPSITVDTAGTYMVTVTENGCDTILGPVTVFVYPEINTAINGQNYICEGDCITLTAPAGAGYVYQWLDENDDPIVGQIYQTYFTCYNSHPPMVSVEITDANGCTAVSDPWLLESGANPSIITTVIGDECAGSDNVLIANIATAGMTNADVTFSWSTGDTGNSIVVNAAGQYTVTAVHNITGCSGSATFFINPLPDFCIMPSGCYTVCNPDTLWGPDGLMSYQWNKDGSIIPGATNSFYYVTMSGSYSLTGTTDAGCTDTSDTLILEVKNCYDCEDTSVEAIETTVDNGGECCYDISYTMNFDSIVSLDISTSDADVNIHNLLPDFLLFSNSGGNAVINSTSTSGHLDQGTISNAFDLCLTNVTASPQTVIFSWIHASDGVVCTDTLVFDCPVSTGCAYIDDMDIYCEGDDHFMNFTICNPLGALFDVAYFSLFTSGPTDFGIVPLDFDITGTPITDGTCQSFTVALTGVGIAYEELCLGVLAHSANPDEFPDALCCTADSTFCAIVPGCTPCEQTYVTAEKDSTSTDCCYEVTAYNNYDVTFTQININVLTDETTISINNPIGSPWTPLSITSVGAELDYAPGEIPLGATDLPDICVTATESECQLVEVQWLIGDEIFCRDTLELKCDPPCGYFIAEKDNIICLDDGTWLYQGIFTNTSPYTISELYINFPVGSGLEIYNQTVTGLSVPPMGTSGVISIPIGAPATSGELCFDVIMHTLDADGNNISCCQFSHCIILPDCEVDEECICDSSFEDEVEAGIDCHTVDDFLVSISPAGNLLECDEVTYYIDNEEIVTLTGTQGFSYDFGGPGKYKICITVIRIADDGKACEAKYCKKIELEQEENANISLYPNPSSNSVNIDLRELVTDEHTTIKIFNPNQRLVMECRPDNNLDKITHINTENLQSGVYFIIVDNGESIYRKSLLVVR